MSNSSNCLSWWILRHSSSRTKLTIICCDRLNETFESSRPYGLFKSTIKSSITFENCSEGVWEFFFFKSYRKSNMNSSNSTGWRVLNLSKKTQNPTRSGWFKNLIFPNIFPSFSFLCLMTWDVMMRPFLKILMILHRPFLKTLTSDLNDTIIAFGWFSFANSETE